MPRRDQYGTHDEHNSAYRERGARGGAREESAAPRAGHGRKGPDYGNAAERTARTSGGSEAEFQGRDYERENYGGGYGNQRKTREVPAAGRKGEWMHSSRGGRGEPNWRGQEGGGGMDGLASERAFGSDPGHQMSATDHDTAYQRWRDAELSRHDEDYRAWRRQQQARHDQDFARWKATRGPVRGGR